MVLDPYMHEASLLAGEICIGSISVYPSPPECLAQYLGQLERIWMWLLDK